MVSLSLTFCLAITAILQGAFSGTVRQADNKPLANVAVLLEGSARATPTGPYQIDQRGKLFIPHVLIVPVGAKVAFPNNDTVLHNVFAQFEAQRFDLGLYPRGTTAYQRFEKPGIVAVRCNIHSQMSAYVVVTETPFAAVTGRDGRFKIGAIPPGTYRLRLWHESGALTERTVSITGGEQTVELTLSRK